jgi:hypothetical protein
MKISGWQEQLSELIVKGIITVGFKKANTVAAIQEAYVFGILSAESQVSLSGTDKRHATIYVVVIYCLHQ